MLMRLLVGVAIAFALLLESVHAACSCTPTSLCQPLQTAMPDKEVFIYYEGGGNWQSFNWYANSLSLTALTAASRRSLVTTIAVDAPLPQALLCLAHQNGVRVVIPTVGPPLDQLTNATYCALWVEQQVQNVIALGADGITLDIEGNTANRDALTALTNATYRAFKSQIPGSQGVSGGYDFVELAKVTDFFFVMAYDMCWGTSVGSANSPYNNVQVGLQQYQTLGISPSSLVLAIPWYGYDFPCQAGTTQNATSCPCSGFTANWQVLYSTIQQSLAVSTTGLQWDSTSDSPYFNYVSGGTVHQVWYDDPQSSSMKYELAASLGLRGIGVYAADFLNYSSPNFYQPMWRALESFFPNNTASTSSPVSSSSSPASTLGSLFLSLFYYVNTNGS